MVFECIWVKNVSENIVYLCVNLDLSGCHIGGVSGCFVFSSVGVSG